MLGFSVATCHLTRRAVPCCQTNPTCKVGFEDVGTSCGTGKSLVEDTAKKCSGAACSVDDCCADNQACSASVCSTATQVLKKGLAAGTLCTKQVCDPDEGTCCEDLTCAFDGTLCTGITEQDSTKVDVKCVGNPCSSDECCADKDTPTCADQQVTTPSGFCGSKEVFLKTGLDTQDCPGTCTPALCCEASDNPDCSTAAGICDATQVY